MVKVRDVQPIMEHLLDRAEKAEKELAIYKKALELACINASNRECISGCKDCICNIYISCYDYKHLKETFLNKAREIDNSSLSLDKTIDKLIKQLEDKTLSKEERDSLLQTLDEYQRMRQERNEDY